MAEGRADGTKVTNQVNYVREQKGHSIILHCLLICVGVGLFTIPYYTISKNHYWHAQQELLGDKEKLPFVGSFKYAHEDTYQALTATGTVFC